MIIYFLNGPSISEAKIFFSNIENYSIYQFSYKLFYIGVFLGIPLFMFYRLIYPKKMRTKIIHPKTGYHPFYFDNYFKDEKRNQISDEIMGLIIFLIMNMIVLITELIKDKNYKEVTSNILFLCIYWLNIIYFGWNLLSGRSLSISNAHIYSPFTADNSLIIEVKYFAYLKNRNEGAMPYLQLGQRLECKTKNIPRTKKEENTVFIYNNNHPEKDYLITKIEDEGLCEIINKGIALHAELCSIEKYSKLHIKLWFEDENKI